MVCAAERSWDLNYRGIIKAMMMSKRMMEESVWNKYRVIFFFFSCENLILQMVKKIVIKIV